MPLPVKLRAYSCQRRDNLRNTGTHELTHRISALEKIDINFTVQPSTLEGSIKCYRFRNNYVFCF